MTWLPTQFAPALDCDFIDNLFLNCGKNNSRAELIKSKSVKPSTITVASISSKF